MEISSSAPPLQISSPTPFQTNRAMTTTPTAKPTAKTPTSPTGSATTFSSLRSSNRMLYRDVKWREHTAERDNFKANTTCHIMTYYLDNRHKSKPKRVAGFKKPHETPEMVLSNVALTIFPKYPLPLNFLHLQQHRVLQRPPVLRSTNGSIGSSAAEGASPLPRIGARSVEFEDPPS